MNFMEHLEAAIQDCESHRDEGGQYWPLKLSSLLALQTAIKNDPETRSIAGLLQDNARLQAIVDAVDEVLVVNWVGPRKDGDYRKALHDLITQNIKEHDDPAISEIAQQRQALLEACRGLVLEVGEAESWLKDTETFDKAKVALEPFKEKQ